MINFKFKNIKLEWYLFYNRIEYGIKDKPYQNHRKNGPAVISYNNNRNIDKEYYYFNNKFHREDGPAFILYREDSSILEEQYLINDKFHREDGPAVIRYNENGNVINKHYFVNGEKIIK